MSKRDFFKIIIKLFGLNSAILSIFYFIPANIQYSFGEFNFIVFLGILGATALSILVCVFLLFKAGKIVDLLKLDKGFDNEQINFKNFNGENLIKIATIIVGGIMVVEYIPEFLINSFYGFKKKPLLKQTFPMLLQKTQLIILTGEYQL